MGNYNRKSVSSMKPIIFFYLGITLSSIDSFPLFKGLSMYSPYFSVSCFIIYYAYHLRNNLHLRFRIVPFTVLTIITVSIIFSLIIGLTKYHDLHGFINFLVQIIIAILLYKSFNHFFQSIPATEYTSHFPTIFIKYSLPIIIIGVIEVFLFPFKGIFSSFISFFSWRCTLDRIQLVSGEPAWASRFLISFLCMIPLSTYFPKQKLFLTIVSIFLLIFTGSTLGLICVMIYYLITYFKKKYLQYYILVFITLIAVFPIMKYYISDYTKARIELLSQLGTSDIESLAVSAGSGSMMARLGNPILAINMGIDYPFLGVGGGYYYINHTEYMDRIFPTASQITNITETGTTPKNLFSRIFAELGLFSILTLFLILAWVYKTKVHNNLYRGVFVTIILLTLNFDSLFHIYPLLLFCFLYNYPPNRKPRQCNP